jgi:sigma-B regulation protein RsbU (phosphoserine phosphatase)
MELDNRKPLDEITFLDQEAQDFIAATGQSLSDLVDVDAGLTRLLVQITEFLGAEECSMFLADESSGDLVLRYAAGGVGADIIGLRLESGQGVVGWVIKNSEDLIVPYPGLDVRFFKGVDARTGFTTRSILCAPIRANGKTIGAIEVLNKRVGTFDDDDLVVLRAIARLVADAISVTDS